MSILNPLPEIKCGNTDSAVRIGISYVFSNSKTKHEYSHIFTFARLVKGSIQYYRLAQEEQNKFIQNQESVYVTGLVNFTNYIEACITTLHRASKVLGSVLRHYPEYRLIAPMGIGKLQRITQKYSNNLRNTIEHIDENVIDKIPKNIDEPGGIFPAINSNLEFELSGYSIPIQKIVDSLESFNEFSNNLANKFVGKNE